MSASQAAVRRGAGAQVTLTEQHRQQKGRRGEARSLTTSQALNFRAALAG